MIKSLLKDDINVVPFVVSNRWHATSKSNPSLLLGNADYEYSEFVNLFISESLSSSHQFISESKAVEPVYFESEYVSSSISAFFVKNLAVEFMDHGNGWQLSCSSSSFSSSKIPYNGPVYGFDLPMDVPITNSSYNLCMEQSEDNFVTIENGVYVHNNVKFDPKTEPQNLNDTFKRITHNQIKNLFYNDSGDPTKLLGLENFDLFLDSKNRVIYDNLKVVTIPQAYFGDSIVKNSVEILDNTGDQSYTIVDDGLGNLYARDKVFSVIKNDQNKTIKYYNTASVVKLNSDIQIQINETVEADHAEDSHHHHPPLRDADPSINWLSYNDNEIYVHRDIASSFFVYGYDRSNIINFASASSNLIYLGHPSASNYNVKDEIPHEKLLGYLKKLECGNNFVVALSENGTVVSWGTASWSSASTLPTFSENIIDISVGDRHAIALGQSGKIYTWGDSSFTGSIPNHVENNYKYIKAGPSGSVAIHVNNRIYGFGHSSNLLLSAIPHVNNVSKISFGLNHGMILDNSGNLYSWQSGSTYSQSIIPVGYSQNVTNVECGDNHTIILNSDKTVACWGLNTLSQSAVPFGTTIQNGSYKVDSLASVGLSEITNVFAKGNRTGISKSRVLQPSTSKSTRLYATWGINALIIQYKVAQFSIGRDYNMIDLDNSYQKLKYRLSHNSPKVLTGTYGTHEFSTGKFRINFINNNEYNLDKYFIKISADLNKPGDTSPTFSECEFPIEKINNKENHSHISPTLLTISTGLTEIYLDSNTPESLNSNHSYVGSSVHLTRLTSPISFGTNGYRDYNNVMVGKFISYNPKTKLLNVYVTDVIGEGIYDNWAVDFNRISVDELISELKLGDNIYGRFYTSGSYVTSSNYNSIRNDELFTTTYLKTNNSYDPYY